MNTFYISKLDETDKTYFEIDPIVPPAPKETKSIIDFVSTAAWDDGGVIIEPARSTLDLGVVTQGGDIGLSGDYMSLTQFELFMAKFKANPPEEFIFYDASRDIQYRVIIKSFDYDYVTGTKIINWKMDLINLEVL